MPAFRRPAGAASRAGEPGGADAREALAELCGAYWYPIYALVRRLGHDEADALDLTQEYFARLLEKPVLAAADRTWGRFRTSSAPIAATSWPTAATMTRPRSAEAEFRHCRSTPAMPRDATSSNRPTRSPPIASSTGPGRSTLLGRALDRLADEYASSGRGPLFERLQGLLISGSRAASHAELAGQLGMTEAAVQQAASRLRRRYREALRDEIAATLDDPSEEAVQSEIRDLFDALGR